MPSLFGDEPPERDALFFDEPDEQDDYDDHLLHCFKMSRMKLTVPT